MSSALRAAGCSFVGPTIMYAFMQVWLVHAHHSGWVADTGRALLPAPRCVGASHHTNPLLPAPRCVEA